MLELEGDVERAVHSVPERLKIDLSRGLLVGLNDFKACKKRDKSWVEVSSMTDQIVGLRG